MTKVAVAIIHGVGTQDSGFADNTILELKDRFASHLSRKVADPKDQLVIEPVHWAPILQSAENRLWRKVNRDRNLDYVKLRRFMIDFAGDAIAYQPTPWGRQVYDAVHCEVAQGLTRLAQMAGPKAPLCVIAHSLGTVIASNYFYDLSRRQRRGALAASVRSKIGNTTLERGDTLALLYTLGSPLAIWSLRHDHFDAVLEVPSPKLTNHHPNVKGEWVNYYDPDDVIGYPLRPISDAYKKQVKKDTPVNVGGLFSSWNPASHLGYWTDNDITKPIAKKLAKTWELANGSP